MTAVTLLPTVRQRRGAVRRLSRALLLTTGMGPRIAGLGNLPPTPCVVAANHASYLDGIIMTAVLPPRFAFVIKNEMRGVPLAHYLLRRIGSFFVERFRPERSAVDARSLLQAAHRGEALAFFPEGTFRREPGLRRFRSGAFAIATKAGLPVLPAAIRGSRAALPAEALLPRPARLDVAILPAIDAAGLDAQALAAAARKEILDALDEPDAARTVRNRIEG